MRIYQVESTNACNLNCEYCPRRFMKRKIGFMDVKTARRIADVMTNKKSEMVFLHHFGEPLLHKNLEGLIKVFKEKGFSVGVNTNGILLTGERAESLIEAEIDRIIVTYHNEDSVRHIEEWKDKRIEIWVFDEEKGKELKKFGVKVEVKKLREGFSKFSEDDARIVKVEGEELEKIRKKCSFVRNREYVVLWNGDIVRCCEVVDFQRLGSIWNDEDVRRLSEDEVVIKKCFKCMGYGNWELETERRRLE